MANYFTKDFEQDKVISSKNIEVKQISLEKIIADENQVRKEFDEDKLGDLAKSIKKQGVLQPILVYRHELEEGQFVIIAGERRWRAAKIAELKFIPCIIQSISDMSIKEIQLVENMHRQDLSTLEASRAIHHFKSERQLSQAQIADNLSLSKTYISKAICVIEKMPAEWLETIENSGKDFAMNQLYPIASSKPGKKRNGLYNALMEELGEAQVELEEPKEKKPMKGGEFSEEDLGKAWEQLKRIKKKDILLLAKYISPKKLQALLEEIRE